MARLTHLDKAGAANMVDVSEKAVTARTARAEGRVVTAADAARLERSGARAMLVGESLMRQADVTAATRGLLG